MSRRAGVPNSWSAALAPADAERRHSRHQNPGNPRADALRESMLERAIGVIYRPESELLSHYFEAVLAEQFDAYVWFEETRAVTPLPAERPQGVPETYPFGL